MFDRNLFLNHFNSMKPTRTYDRVIVDYQGFRWGYYANENIYENLNSGQIISAPLFEDMQNAQSDAASSASSSDDGGFGYSNRSRNVALDISDLLKRRPNTRKRGSFKQIAVKSFLTPETYYKLRLQGVSFTDRWPLKTDLVTRLNYTIKGGVEPYNETVTWYVNGEVTQSLPGQPKALGLNDKNHNDQFTAKITITDSDTPSNRITQLVGVTGVIMQPITYNTLTIDPTEVGLTGSLTLLFDGLTGSPEYLDFNGTPIALPSGIDKQHYLYLGREPQKDNVAGQTRAGPQESPTFSLKLLNDVGYNLEEGLGISGAAILSNNAQTITAPVENTSTIVGDAETIAPSFFSTPTASTTDPTVGDTVSVGNTGATGVPAPTVTFAWYLDGVTIDGETGVSYTTDQTGELEAIVTATNSAGFTNATVDFGTVQEVSEEYSTDFSALAVDISGVSGSSAAVELNGFAYANVTGASVDAREEANYTYNWYREIPELTGITLEIQ